MSHNSDLYKAFIDKSLGRFVEALEVFEADLNSFPQNESRTIFEIILSTPDSASFIEKCIEFGADFYEKNANHKYPIHYVAESKCARNLKAVEALLKIKQVDDANDRKPSPYANVKDRKDQNCLHLLAENLTNENSEKILNIIDILLSCGCNINSPNDDGETPFYIIVRKLPYVENGQSIFDKLLQSTEIDFYTHKGDEIVNMIKNKYIEVMPEKENFVVCYEEMKKLLESGNINKFETLFACYTSSNINEFHNNCYSYMEIAVQKSYINIVDLLIKKEINFNKTSVENGTGIPPPFQAYKDANVEIFKSFLLADIKYKIDFYCHDKNCQKTLFHHFFSDMKGTEKTTKFQTIVMTSKQKKCFDLLINDPRCKPECLNALDECKKSVIYYSVRFGIDYMTLKLLEKGAFIGKVMTKIRKSLLNDFLDSCIQSNDEFHDNNSFQISVNYGFLIPTPDVCDAMKQNKKKKKIDESIAETPFSSKNAVSTSRYDFENPTKIYVPEMWTLKLLVHNYDYRKFIMHPVLSSFIFLKWKKIRFSLHINLIIFFFFIFTFIPFIMISKSDQNSLTYKIFFGLSFTSLFILSCREVLQCIQSKKRYFKCYSNFVDLVMIISGFIVLFRLPLTNHQYRLLHTVIILLATWEYFNLLGYLPLLSVSLHTKIFRKVFTTFIKSIAFYSVMVIGFALAFYTMNGDKAMKMKNNVASINNVTSIDRDTNFNSFTSVRLSIVKSFVMMIGELDTSEIHLEGYSYIGLFMLFLFIVSIVLYNLLNALAVSDTQEIRSEAKLIDLRQRILVMYNHEKYALSISSKLNSFLQKILLLFSETIKSGTIFLKPNAGRHTYSKIDCKSPIKNDWLPKILCYFGQYMTMDKEIIQDMCSLLVKKREKQNEQKIENLKEKRSDKMAYDIIKLNEQISQMEDQRKIMNEIEALRKLILMKFEEKNTKTVNTKDLLDC